MDSLKEEIKKDAEKKKDESDKRFHGNQHVVSSPNGEQSIKKVHTDKEIAKKAGVGIGTVTGESK